MTLYDLPGCPYCAMVRDKLQDLELSYETIIVPSWQGARKEVFAVSGQYLVPVLVDGEVMLDDEDTILPYLEKTYGKKSS